MDKLHRYSSEDEREFYNLYTMHLGLNIGAL